MWDKGAMRLIAWWMVLAMGVAACGKKEGESPAVTAGGGAKPAAMQTDDLPTDPEERHKVTYIRAAQAFSRNDLETAIKFLEMAELAKPGQANTANLKGAIYTRQRDWPKAQTAFEDALKLQPDLPMAQFNLGEDLS